jgi:hypothetical protein
MKFDRELQGNEESIEAVRGTFNVKVKAEGLQIMEGQWSSSSSQKAPKLFKLPSISNSNKSSKFYQTSRGLQQSEIQFIPRNLRFVPRHLSILLFISPSTNFPFVYLIFHPRSLICLPKRLRISTFCCSVQTRQVNIGSLSLYYSHSVPPMELSPSQGYLLTRSGYCYKVSHRF